MILYKLLGNEKMFVMKQFWNLWLEYWAFWHKVKNIVIWHSNYPSILWALIICSYEHTWARSKESSSSLHVNTEAFLRTNRTTLFIPKILKMLSMSKLTHCWATDNVVKYIGGNQYFIWNSATPTTEIYIFSCYYNISRR